MKKLLILSSLIIFVFVNNTFGQVVIGQPQQQQQPNQQQPQQQQNQQTQQVSYNQQQQSQQQQLTPEQMKFQMFEQYVKTFYPEATASWVGSHTTADTVSSPVSGYKIIRFSNGQPAAMDYVIPKGSVLARYNDGTTNEYYYSVSENAYIVKDGRYADIKRKMEKQEKQNEKDAKKLARQNRTPQEKQMVMQRDIMIAQAGYNIFLQVFGMIQQNRMIRQVYGNANVYGGSYNNGVLQTSGLGGY